MKQSKAYRPENLHYLKMLARQYPNVQAASTEIINLQAILNLPKGTEHFISDVHGEYEAFLHILNSASGVVREKLDDLFGTSLSPRRSGTSLATLIYYPKEKLEEISARRWTTCGSGTASPSTGSSRCAGWSAPSIPAPRCARPCRRSTPTSSTRCSTPTTRTTTSGTTTRTSSPPSSTWTGHPISWCSCASSSSAWRWTTSTWWGTSSTGGPGRTSSWTPCMDYHSVDIQWGNHDILWMGAASGSRTLVATVLANSLRYNNLEVIETGYGISLRPLSVFANEVYKDCDVQPLRRQAHRRRRGPVQREGQAAVRPDAQGHHHDPLQAGGAEDPPQPRASAWTTGCCWTRSTMRSSAPCHRRRPTYPMEDMRLPHRGPRGPLRPHPGGGASSSTSSPRSFLHSEKLQRHVRFLYSKGSLYKVFNGNLLFHGCIPMTEDGELLTLSIGGKELLRQGVFGLRRPDRPPGLLQQARLHGAAVRHGLSVVAVGRAEQPHLRPGPDDHLRAAASSRTRPPGPSPRTPTTASTTTPQVCDRILRGVRPGGPALPHHQRPHPRQVQEGGEPHQGRRQAAGHRRRLLQGLSADHRHRGLYPDLQLRLLPPGVPRALCRPGGRHPGATRTLPPPR